MLKYKISTELDDPETSEQHRRIILSKPFLKELYEEWYNVFVQVFRKLPQGKILEIGSGGGFLKEVFPNVITSDILPLSSSDMTFSAESLPFSDNELSGICMLDVFHHLPLPYLFLKEAERTLKSGGKIVMIEPANTFLSRFIYKKLHHEVFDEHGGWQLEEIHNSQFGMHSKNVPGNKSQIVKGALSSSNIAFPYIYFERDREKFSKEFPSLKLTSIKYHTPFRYILSGGVSRKAIVPAFSFPFFRFIENILSPLNKVIGMFETVIIEKK